MEPGLPWEGEHGLDPSSLPRITVPHDPVRARPTPTDLREVGDLPVAGAAGGMTTVAQVLARSATDAWLVMHAGIVVSEWYRAGVSAVKPRLVMSISKTVVGAVTGCLVGLGRLRAEDLVTKYVPELAGSGYAGATVRDVLDMRSGVEFREEYTDPTSHIRAMDAAIAGVPGAAPGLKSFLMGLRADRGHGQLFDYRSCESDVLGWVCERAAGVSMADLVSRLVWGPIGATSDAAFLSDWTGTPIYDGGLMATARDLGRFGEVLLDGGVSQGVEVLPRTWVSAVWGVDPELRAAFANSAAGPFLPGGWYRNQCWVLPGPHGDVLLGLGIHGQLLRVDPATRTVRVKLSSWTAPQAPLLLHDTLRACDAVAAAVSGRQGRAGPRFGPGESRLPPVSGR
jgi:hypothetical protein